MSLDPIKEKLVAAARQSPQELLLEYKRVEDEFIRLLAEFKGVKSEIVIDVINSRTDNLIKFGALFSDIILINQKAINRLFGKSHFSVEDAFRRKDDPITIDCSKDFLPFFDDSKRDITRVYVYHNDEDLRSLVTSYKPFMDAGRLLIRPSRALLGFEKKDEKEISLVYADSDTPTNRWQVGLNGFRDTIFIDNGYDNRIIKTLFETTIPYFDQASTESINKVLEDENLMVSSFRKALLQVVEDGVKDGRNIKQISNDLIRPEVERLGSKFRKQQSLHGDSIRSGLIPYTLSLLACTGDLKAVLSALGGAAAVMIGQEISNRGKRNDLSDNPFYLLWKINEPRYLKPK